MQSTSATYKALFAAEAPAEFRVLCGTDVYTKDRIVLRSLKTQAALLRSDQLVGNCISSQLDVSLRNPGVIPRMAQLSVEVRLNDGTTQSEWLSKGSYFIDTRNTEPDPNDSTKSVLTLHAYDAMLKTEQSFTQAGDQGEWPRTDITVVNEIAQRIGVSVDARTTAMLNNGYLVQYPGIVLEDGTPKYSADGGLTMRGVLSYIGVMYGGNWCISDAGNLRLVVLGTPKIDTSNSLKFSSSAPFTLSVHNQTKNWDGTLEWTNGQDDWNVWDGTTTLASGSDNKLYLRGTENTYLSEDDSESGDYRFVLSGSNVSCDGNIETLLDYQTVADGGHPETAYLGFSFLFSQNAALVKAPDIVADYSDMMCYSYIFSDCTNLRIPGAISATTLDVGACYRAYKGCVNLEMLPSISAMNFNEECCAGMFSGCTKIKLSETQSEGYAYPYRIPPSGNATAGLSPFLDMFSNTGGTFTGTPNINTTYYTDHEPV